MNVALCLPIMKPFLKKLQDAGDSVGERLWQLPLWDVYKQDIESDIADVKIIVSQLPGPLAQLNF
jgi:leucyl aminopeptidase